LDLGFGEGEEGEANTEIEGEEGGERTWFKGGGIL
jgi:hypothetical protein